MLVESRNLWLDLIRGFSALLVCLGHLRNAILVDFSDLMHPNILLKAFYALSGLGHQAVMVFFVLSGYFVGGAVLRAGAKFSWKSYLISRLTRLWVVLLPSLLLTWLIGLMLVHFSPETLAGAYVEQWHSGPKPGEYSISLNTFFANIFFLQTVVSPVFGLNSPLWSLANEFWYYLIFPLLLVVIGIIGTSGYLPRLATFFIAMIIGCFLPEPMLMGFLVWLMGVAVYCLQAIIKPFSTQKSYATLLAALALFVFALGFSKVATSAIQADIAVGLTFALMCLIFTRLPFSLQRWPLLAKLALCCSEVSYSLYLSHFPLVILIAAFMYHSQKLAPSFFVFAQLLGWFVLLLGFGFLMWWLFESRTTFVRNILMSKIGKA